MKKGVIREDLMKKDAIREHLMKKDAKDVLFELIVPTEKYEEVVIFYHHDADGYMSAALVLQLLNYSVETNAIVGPEGQKMKITPIEIDHSKIMRSRLPHNLNSKTKFFILDYSFSNEEDIALVADIINVYGPEAVTWIDHHKSSLEVAAKLKELTAGIMPEGILVANNVYAGCMLTQFYLLYHNMYKIVGRIARLRNRYNPYDGFIFSEELRAIDERLVCNFDDIANFKEWPEDEEIIKKVDDFIAHIGVPMEIIYTDDYDKWKHQFADSKAYVKGLFSVFNKEEVLTTYGNLDMMYGGYEGIHEDYYANLCYKVIKEGKNLIEKERIQNEEYIEDFGIVARLSTAEVKKMFPMLEEENDFLYILCLNKIGNSMMFNDHIKEYDAVMTFVFNGDVWSHSIFSDESRSFPLEKIAMYYNEKYGLSGGGHNHAAGWNTPECLFSIKDGLIVNSWHYVKAD